MNTNPIINKLPPALPPVFNTLYDSVYEMLPREWEVYESKASQVDAAVYRAALELVRGAEAYSRSLDWDAHPDHMSETRRVAHYGEGLYGLAKVAPVRDQIAASYRLIAGELVVAVEVAARRRRHQAVIAKCNAELRRELRRIEREHQRILNLRGAGRGTASPGDRVNGVIPAPAMRRTAGARGRPGEGASGAPVAGPARAAHLFAGGGRIKGKRKNKEEE
jgi:hypothetical protein